MEKKTAEANQIIISESLIPLYTANLRIPFPSKREAEVAYNVLRIDVEPKRSAITKNLKLEVNNNSNILQVEFTGELAKNVRIGISYFFESLILLCETLKVFGPPADKYDHFN